MGDGMSSTKGNNLCEYLYDDKGIKNFRFFFVLLFRICNIY